MKHKRSFPRQMTFAAFPCQLAEMQFPRVFTLNCIRSSCMQLVNHLKKERLYASISWGAPYYVPIGLGAVISAQPFFGPSCQECILSIKKRPSSISRGEGIVNVTTLCRVDKIVMGVCLWRGLHIN